MPITFGGGGLRSVAPSSLTGAGAPRGFSNLPSGGGRGGSGGTSRGGRGGGQTSPQYSVTINPIGTSGGAEVVINGVGYSVAAGKVKDFLSSKGISGGAYQSHIEKASKLDTAYKTDIQLRERAGLIKTQLLSDFPTLARTRNVDLIARNLASGKITDFGGKRYGMASQATGTDIFFPQSRKEDLLTAAAKRNMALAEDFNTVKILTDETGTKVQGVEYGGKSYSKQAFENTYGSSVLYDPDKQEFFFGTLRKTETKPVSSISAGFKPITAQERRNVQKALVKAKIKAVAKGELSVLEAVTNIPINKWKQFAYDQVTGVTTGISKIADTAIRQSNIILNESNLKTGNKYVDITRKGLGLTAYAATNAIGFGLNMISGMGNLANNLTFKTSKTTVDIIKNSPAIIKGSLYEVGKVTTGNGNIQEFFSAALTVATVAGAAASFSRLAQTSKFGKNLKGDLPQIKRAVKESQALLKKEQVYTQKIFMKSSNKFETFGKAYQAYKGMNSKVSWHSFTNGKASVVLQKAVLQNKNVRILNVMAARSTTEKILGFLRSFKNRTLTFAEAYPNTKKISAYFSKTRAQRLYTLIEVRGSKYVTAIDGKGNVNILKNMNEVQSFIRNAKYGRFSFTGSRAIGGSVETILRVGKKGFIGSEAFSRFAYKKTAGISSIFKEPTEKGGMQVIRFKGGKKTPFSATFGQAQEVTQAQVSKNVGISKGISNSVTRSQLRNVVKAVEKAIRKNDIVVRNGYKAVLGASGMMFFDKYGKLVNARDAIDGSSKDIDRFKTAIGGITGTGDKSGIIPKPVQRTPQGSRQPQAMQQRQRQAQQQQQRLEQAQGRAGGSRTSFKFEPRARRDVDLPSIEKKNKVIIKSILGSKIAPSYEIIIGSGKKVKKLGGRYSAKDAISKGAYTIDRTKERTVRIVPSKQKPNSKFSINYLAQANRKFRNYRIRKGKRVAYSSTRLIEKRKYFNDLERLNRFKKKRR